MATDDDKNKISKLLQGIETPDIKLSERCSVLIKDFQEKFGKEVEEEEQMTYKDEVICENPYKPPKLQLDDINRKLNELLKKTNRSMKHATQNVTSPGAADQKRPWRTNSHKEKLLRINNELKYHHEKGVQSVAALESNVMKNLIQEGEIENRESTGPTISADKLRDVIDSAKRNLPNFQYRKVDNTTATVILPSAHKVENPAAASTPPTPLTPPTVDLAPGDTPPHPTSSKLNDD